MTAITYTAKDRGDLISGHSAETQYTFDLFLQEYQGSTTRQQNTQKSLSGNRVTTLHHLERTFSVVTSPTASSTIIQNIREFLSSVAGGESFTLDVYGFALSPADPQTFKLDGNYSESLNTTTNETTFEFRIVKV